ncbi:unnamed protein product [Brassica rapa]|uniref:C2 domain-containing protein n=1 Tax=Brassica campestris TaxID=3711 RepID=A0A3P5YAM5_BRACM|nr:unnamed protein product [Brassica rapa]VDC64526.1 unnamed protein product [Brassica rapa]
MTVPDAKTSSGNEKLVVEIIGAHNLMPKDGEGSSSPFVEVEFEDQRLRTHVKRKDLNPIWNEKLVFHVIDANELRYKTLEISVFNEKRSSNSRNFLGKVRVTGSSVGREGESVAKLYTLEKRSLFSHVRGEISLKHYVTTTTDNDVNISRVNGSGGSKKSKKVSSSIGTQQQQQQQQQIALLNHQQHNQQRMLPFYPNQGEIKPLVITALPGPRPGPGPVLYSNGSSEFSLKETKPRLGGVTSGLSSHKDKTSSTYDLVEQMQYLYVRVMKAKDLSVSGELVSEIKLGNYKGVTKKVSSSNLEWNQVFAFSKETIQSSVVEIFLREVNRDEYTGRVWFDLSEIPTRVPPDSPLAPQWYKVESRNGVGGELMVSVWFGTQADEAFAEAWHSKAGNVHIKELSSIKSKVYLSPKLWYLRVSVIEAQDVAVMNKGTGLMRFPELSAKLHVGSQILRTTVSASNPTRSFTNPYWNEDLMFVVAEPFEDCINVIVEDRVSGNDVGRVQIPVLAVERRTGDKPVGSRWFTLDNGNNNSQFGSRIHLRLSLDGGYHVLDEATMYTSDVRPTAKELWKPHVGLLEIGILGATGLMPMKVRDGKGSGTADSYCVAKYGPKWVRTRTVVDSLCPKWNEQYTWEVNDPCTVVTIGVFDNARVDKSNSNTRDARIGKVRIRLSTLETERVYTHSYPLLVLHATGVKKTGELHLAVRLSCGNAVNMFQMYTLPLLPKMHYTQPLGVHLIERLRYQTLNAVAERLSRAEPPLGREVVEYMLDHDFHVWSMRRSKSNFFRLVNVVSSLVWVARLVEAMRSWTKPVCSTVFVVVFLFMVLFPELILPSLFLYAAGVGVWRFRKRPRHPPHMDARISHAETVFPDELDEEFDTFPTSRGFEVVRMRYDRVRSIAGRIQTVVGDMASQGERAQALLSWRDPRATFIFLVFCLVSAVGFYVVPVKLTVAVSGLYYLRPPRFRRKLPSRGLSFFRRLPSRADSLL